MRITSGGDVGINTTTGINVAGGWTNLTVNGSTTGIIGVQIAGTSFGAMYGNLANNNFAIQAYGTSNNANMIFLTSSTERMRITSGGQVNIGGTNTTIWTSTSSTINQVSINNTDYPFAAARASNIVAILNRTTSNGVILEFKYDGAVVGSVSTNANSLPSDLNFKKDITNISLG
ncbi:MAG: hypothetical protein ACOVOV_12285, partial [Dolichospermum sp.]